MGYCNSAGDNNIIITSVFSLQWSASNIVIKFYSNTSFRIYRSIDYFYISLSTATAAMELFPVTLFSDI